MGQNLELLSTWDYAAYTGRSKSNTSLQCKLGNLHNLPGVKKIEQFMGRYILHTDRAELDGWIQKQKES